VLSITRHAASLSLLGLLILCTACRETGAPSPHPGASMSRSFQFALLGDNPYPAASVPKFRALIDEVNLDSDLEWVIHVGDILLGGAECSDDEFNARFDLFQRFQIPFVFTPGDNDWFDCAGEAEKGFYDYERLDSLREIFFPKLGLTSGGRTMEVNNQSDDAGFEEFVENTMWVKHNIVFSTVHLVALTRPASDPERARARLEAASAWITKTFQLAKELDSPGVFIATQADPWIVTGLPLLIERICADCLQPRAGLERLGEVLEKQSLAFEGSVVLAVGDTHVFRVDKPLYSSKNGELIENFTRVETFGHPHVHWVRVRVDPDDDEVFAFEQEIVQVDLH
jgi:hypothetical protein